MDYGWIILVLILVTGYIIAIKKISRLHSNDAANP